MFPMEMPRERDNRTTNCGRFPPHVSYSQSNRSRAVTVVIVGVSIANTPVSGDSGGGLRNQHWCLAFGITRFATDSQGEPIDACVIEIGGALYRGFHWDPGAGFSMSEE